MKTKTIAARTKCIVAALILSMSIGVMPVYAVQPVQETNVAVEQSQDSVEEKAAAYFANFPEDKHVVSAADFLKMVENKENICVLDIRSRQKIMQRDTFRVRSMYHMVWILQKHWIKSRMM